MLFINVEMGAPLGGHAFEKICDKGCIPDGLVGCLSGQIGKQSLDAPAPQISHKPPGVDRVCSAALESMHYRSWPNHSHCEIQSDCLKENVTRIILVL